MIPIVFKATNISSYTHISHVLQTSVDDINYVNKFSLKSSQVVMKKICERLKAQYKRGETKDGMMRDVVTDKVTLQIAS
jgi:hypothetical protein